MRTAPPSMSDRVIEWNVSNWVAVATMTAVGFAILRAVMDVFPQVPKLIEHRPFPPPRREKIFRKVAPSSRELTSWEVVPWANPLAYHSKDERNKRHQAPSPQPISIREAILEARANR